MNTAETILVTHQGKPVLSALHAVEALLAARPHQFDGATIADVKQDGNVFYVHTWLCGRRMAFAVKGQ